MGEKIQDANSNKFAVQPVALVVRAQFESIATHLEYFPIEAGAEKSFERRFLPTRHGILVDLHLVFEEDVVPVRCESACSQAQLVHTSLL